MSPVFIIWLIEIKTPSQGKQEIKLFSQSLTGKNIYCSNVGVSLSQFAVYDTQCDNLTITLGFMPMGQSLLPVVALSLDIVAVSLDHSASHLFQIKHSSLPMWQFCSPSFSSPIHFSNLRTNLGW